MESTFNWYWLVDLLMDAGYRLHLANPAAIQKYKGLKHSDDNHDAFWLAHMLTIEYFTGRLYLPQREQTEYETYCENEAIWYKSVRH